MNIIFVEPDEIRNSRVTLVGRRSEHIRSVLKCVAGDTVRIGVAGGPTGSGEIIAIDNGAVELAVTLKTTAPAQPGIDLILALPRPIMLQRIFFTAAQLGIARIFLIRSNRVEKSFFSASLLDPEETGRHLRLGMEQAGDTWLPEVFIFPRFRPFVEDFLPSHLPSCPVRLLPHPGVAKNLAEAAPPPVFGRAIIAIGPEGGWVDYEVEQLAGLDFIPFSMGDRILRVETAITALSSQLNLLREWGSAP